LSTNNIITVDGEIHLNGAPYNNAELKRIAGYVMQDDLSNVSLTVEETLMYTTKLRLRRIFTDKEQKEHVVDVMAEMVLSHVHSVIVGTPLKKVYQVVNVNECVLVWNYLIVGNYCFLMNQLQLLIYFEHSFTCTW